MTPSSILITLASLLLRFSVPARCILQDDWLACHALHLVGMANVYYHSSPSCSGQLAAEVGLFADHLQITSFAGIIKQGKFVALLVMQWRCKMSVQHASVSCTFCCTLTQIYIRTSFPTSALAAVRSAVRASTGVVLHGWSLMLLLNVNTAHMLHAWNVFC